jgi:rhodanese-related sulfurtransferase
MTSPDSRVIVVCNEGYASSLAAAVLRDLGLPRVTDLAGGHRAWRDARRPGTPPDGQGVMPVRSA